LFPNSVCTTFQLIPIPLRYLQKSNPQREFIFSVFSKTNILFSNPIPSIGKNAENEKDLTYVRLYLGLDNKLFEEAIGRMIESNIVFDN